MLIAVRFGHHSRITIFVGSRSIKIELRALVTDKALIGLMSGVFFVYKKIYFKWKKSRRVFMNTHYKKYGTR